MTIGITPEEKEHLTTAINALPQKVKDAHTTVSYSYFTKGCTIGLECGEEINFFFLLSLFFTLDFDRRDFDKVDKLVVFVEVGEAHLLTSILSFLLSFYTKVTELTIINEDLGVSLIIDYVVGFDKIECLFINSASFSPTVLEHFPNIKELTICTDQDTVPNMNHLSNLEKLTIKESEVRIIEIEKVPTTVNYILLFALPKLTELPPDFFTSLSNLKTFRAINTGITTLPVSIINAVSLYDHFWTPMPDISDLPEHVAQKVLKYRQQEVLPFYNEKYLYQW